MRKLLRGHGCPRVIVTDKLRSYASANNKLGLNGPLTATAIVGAIGDANNSPTDTISQRG